MSKQPHSPASSDPKAPLRTAAKQRLAGAAPTPTSPTQDELVHELQVHQIELEMQNEELKRSHLALEESRNKYVDLYDFAPVGYFTIAHTGLITEANLNGAALLGVPRQQLLKQRFRRFVTPTDVERWDRLLVAAFQHTTKQACEVALRRRDGTVFHARLDLLWMGDSGEQPGTAGKPPLIRVTLSDITERMRTEAALAESKERFQALFEHAADAIVVFDAQTLDMLNFNDEACRRLGYLREEFAKLKLSDFEVIEDALEIKRHVRNIQMANGDIFESKLKTKSGKILDIEIRAKAIRLNGKVSIQAIWRDVTERKLTEATLRKLTAELKQRVAWGTAEVQRLAAIVQHSNEMIGLAEPDLRCVFVNDAGAKLLGIDAAAVHRHNVLDFLPAEVQQRLRMEIMPVVQKMEVWQGEIRFRNLATSADRCVAASIFTLQNPIAGQPKYLAITAIDISSRKELETQVLEISEREQRRIGNDLHDGLGQQLAAIKLMSSTLASQLAKKKLPDARRAAQIERELQRALEETRQIARGLLPVRPSGESLRSALYELAAGITQIFKIPCRFVHSDVMVHDYHAATHLFRIAQEAANNATRHAQAKHIWIRLRSINGHIRLSISDDGCGLPVASQRAAGLGLRIMQYRAAVIGATFATACRRGGGTRIICDWQSTTPSKVQV